jgi:hypothetical protein
MSIKGFVVEAEEEDLECYLPRFMVDVKNGRDADDICPMVVFAVVCSNSPNFGMISITEIEGSTARDG